MNSNSNTEGGIRAKFILLLMFVLVAGGLIVCFVAHVRRSVKTEPSVPTVVQTAEETVAVQPQVLVPLHEEPAVTVIEETTKPKSFEVVEKGATFTFAPITTVPPPVVLEKDVVAMQKNKPQQ